MSGTDDARDLLDTIAGYSNPKPVGKTDSQSRPLKHATVDPAFNGAGLARVTFDGESLLSVKGYPWLAIGGWAPAAGQRVLMAPSGHGYTILGPLARAAAFLGQVPVQPINGWILYADNYPDQRASRQLGESFAPDPTQVGSSVAGNIYVSRSATGIVHVEGLVYRANAITVGHVIAVLPVGFRPERRQVFQDVKDANTGAIAIMPTGEVVVVGGFGAGFHALNSVRFRAAGTQTFVPLTLASGWSEPTTAFWTASGAGYVSDTTGPGSHTPGYTTDSDGVVLFEGDVVNAAAQNDPGNFCTTGVNFGDNGDTHNLIVNNARFMFSRYRYNGGSGILQTGVAMGAGERTFISQMMVLDKAKNTWRNVNGLNGWNAYGGGWAGPGIIKLSGIVYVHGLWAGGTRASDATGAMMTNPSGWSPRYRSIICTAALAAFARLDSIQNGGPGWALSNIIQANTGSNAWWTSDGISWPAWS